ncbi:LysR family transcriptional regulator [Endozoicomonas lisbonensis]|uniref:DNA-binding transcriptional LysR family regulator n=1 Tax=Endozoicomonas lisbonensis TaxID=3120522 RepID=A0ABV2SEE1_9GAMM
MKYASISAFVAVHETGSISAAARRLHRSRSQISAWVSDLEAEWGLELMDRTSYRPTLTEDGKKLLPYCRQVLSDTVNLHNAVESLKRADASLVVGFDFFLPVAYRKAMVAHFCHFFPEHELTIRQMTTSQLNECLANAEVHLGVVSAPKVQSLSNFSSKQLGMCEFAFCCSSEHPLAGVHEVTDTDLLTHRGILIAGMREFFDARAYTEVPDYETGLYLVRQGIGWCPAPMNDISEEISEGRLVILNYTSAVVSVPVIAYWSNSHVPTGVCQKLLGALPELFAAL